MRDLRLRLAQWIAPPGVDVHDPDKTPCPQDRAILEAADAWMLYRCVDGEAHINVTDAVRAAVEDGLLRPTDAPDRHVFYGLTDEGYRLVRPNEYQPEPSGGYI